MTLRKLAYGLISSALAATLASTAFLACGGLSDDAQQARGDGTDSNTHWLGRCEADGDCAKGLECLCGACTASCDEASACDELGAKAMCVQARCEEQSKRETALCSKGCDDNDDCPADGECEQGVCVPGTGSLVATPAPLPCAPMDVRALNLPCTSPGLFYWDGETCAQQATCSCEGDDCESMFETEAECQRVYAECGVITPSPDDLEEGCDFLLELDPDGACGESDERCQQMESDGRVHAVSCQALDEVEDADGNSVPLSAAETAARVACVENWLKTADASDVTSDESSVSAEGTWAQVGALFAVAGLRCSAECAGETCDYCLEYGESTCGDDPFCFAVFGVPIDEDAQCTLPEEFALCASSGRGCDDAETVARDEGGQCWWFPSICEDPGFEYFFEGDDACQNGYPECVTVPTEPPVEGCEAMDAIEGVGPNCDAIARYAWNGAKCFPIACNCQGEDCERLYDSRDACENHWAGCIESIPLCTDERVPYNQAAGFTWGGDPFSAPDPALAEWTDTVWTEPVQAPVLTECSPVEGFDGNACGSTQRVTFTEGFDPPLEVELILPDAASSAIDVSVGDAVRIRLDSSEFVVLTADDEQPLILIGIGDAYSNGGSPTAVWSIGTLVVEVGAPFCKRPDTEDPDCNWLHVAQNLTISGPRDAQPFNADVLKSVELEPFRDALLSIGTETGTARYHVMQGLSSYTGRERPNASSCAAAFTRGDGFSVVRVVEESP
jgi:hypothetical protein